MFEQDIEVKEIGLHKTFTELLQKELIKEGYDIVTSDELDYLLDRLKLLREDSVKIENVQRIKNELNVSAIIKGYIGNYHIDRETKHGTVRTVGRQLDPNPLHDKADTRIYISNISLRMEMIELEQGSKIWSCSISFKDYKADENGKELIKKNHQALFRYAPKDICRGLDRCKRNLRNKWTGKLQVSFCLSEPVVMSSSVKRVIVRLSRMGLKCGKMAWSG